MTKRFGWMAVMCSVLVAGPVAAQHIDAMAKDAMHDPDGMAMAPHGKFTGAEGHKAAGTYEIVTMEGRTELKLGKYFSVERGPDEEPAEGVRDRDDGQAERDRRQPPLRAVVPERRIVRMDGREQERRPADHLPGLPRSAHDEAAHDR